MGIHICLQNEKGEDHPDWDFVRHAGDREFDQAMHSLPTIERNIFGEYSVRPADFAAWRQFIVSREWPNPGRFEKLLDLLERDTDYWVWVSR